MYLKCDKTKVRCCRYLDEGNDKMSVIQCLLIDKITLINNHSCGRVQLYIHIIMFCMYVVRIVLLT